MKSMRYETLYTIHMLTNHSSNHSNRRACAQACAFKCILSGSCVCLGVCLCCECVVEIAHSVFRSLPSHLWLTIGGFLYQDYTIAVLCAIFVVFCLFVKNKLPEFRVWWFLMRSRVGVCVCVQSPMLSLYLPFRGVGLVLMPPNPNHIRYELVVQQADNDCECDCTRCKLNKTYVKSSRDYDRS